MAARPARPRLHRVPRTAAVTTAPRELAAPERLPAVQHARKRFGQHFLVDGSVIDRIVAAIDPRPGQAIVEIGPGRGALTGPLLERCRALTVIELDRDLAVRLRRTPGLAVIEADVLKVDFAALPAARRGKSCASSATCLTTSRRRSCSICSRRARPSRTSTSCCRRRWSTGWPRRRETRTTAGSRSCCSGATDRAAARRGAGGVRAAAARRLRGSPHDAAADPRRRRSRPAARARHGRLLAASQAAAPHRRPLARGARRNPAVRRPAPRRGSAGRRMDCPCRRAQKNDPGGVGPSLTEGGERSGEGAILKMPGCRAKAC